MSDIQKIKDSLQVQDIVGEYVELKSAGANQKGLCPFHHEKTPSFMVSPQKQIWHCFGCHKGGDIFTFLQEIEGIEFFEALKILAKKANIPLDLKKADPHIASLKERLVILHEYSADFFALTLKNSNSAKYARDYIEKRGLTKNDIKKFQLGYAAESWDSLYTFLKKKSFSKNEIKESGLVVQKADGQYYDRFRDRLMFPLADQNGTVIGFSGRTLKKETGAAKYINSPQTLLYNKSAFLYGLDKAKQKIKQLEYAIIVEGYMDVIASSGAGITNTVAASGTALTIDQIKLLKRYANNVILAFDFDTAGLNASLRGIDLAWQERFSVKIAKLEQGKDPDDVIREDPKKWKHAIAHSVHVIDHYLNILTEKYNPKSADGKKKIAKELIPILARIGDKIEQTHYLQKLSSIINVEENILRQELPAHQSRLIAQDDSRLYSPSVKTAKNSARLLNRVAAILIKYPACIKHIKDIEPLFSDGSLVKNLYISLIKYYDDVRDEFSIDSFRKTLDDSAKKVLDNLELFADKEYCEFNDNMAIAEVKKLKEMFKAVKKQDQISKLAEEVKCAEISGDEKKAQTLMQKLHKLHYAKS